MMGFRQLGTAVVATVCTLALGGSGIPPGLEWTVVARDTNGPTSGTSTSRAPFLDWDLVLCDLDGDGDDEVASYPSAGFAIPGERDAGVSSDRRLCGDWDGDGTDTLGVKRGNRYHLTDTPGGTTAERVFAFGRGNDSGIVGDWDGDGDDEIALHRSPPGPYQGPPTFFFADDLLGSGVDYSLAYGRRRDRPVAGDWDGDGDDTVGLYRGGPWFLRSTVEVGFTTTTFSLGRSMDVPVAGDLDGDGTDTVGIGRPPSWGG